MRDSAVQVVRRLRQAGYEAYFVGGCVRDLLLGLEPDDYDVATSARPEEAAPLFGSTREVGRSFGVLHVLSEGHWVEVATFRSEGAYSDGRHPDEVRFADARQDALRRDFTINALFLDPDGGGVVDFVGGRADLAARLLRCVGDPARRFAEDGLRLLRAVRFACRFGFRIEARTWDAMLQNAARLDAVSPERVRDELLAILTGSDPRRGVTLLADARLLDRILPEVEALRGVEQSPDRHPEGDVWEHTLRMLAGLREPDEAFALGVLLHDIGKPPARRLEGGEVCFWGHVEQGQEMAARVMERLRVSLRTQEIVQAMIGQHMRFLDVPRMKRSTLRRFVLQEHFPVILELHRLDAESSRGDFTIYEFCRREREAIEKEPPPVRPLLSGHDLMALGYAPGPRLGLILHALVDAQLEDEVSDRAGAEAWVVARYAPECAASPGPAAGGEEGDGLRPGADPGGSGPGPEPGGRDPGPARRRQRPHS